MQIAEDTPTRELTILGLTFQVPQPYKPGQVELTEGEASQLNQVLAENLRNNFSQTLYGKIADYMKANNIAEETPEDQKPGPDVLDKDELDNEFEQYVQKYEFGVRQGRVGGPRAPSDPIGKEAHRIAMERVKAAVQKKGIAWDTVGKEKRGELVKQVLDKYPDIRAEAERRVNAIADIAVDEVDIAA